MPSYTTKDIRNVAIVGSPSSGKTTLVETMLHEAGLIGRIGRVEDGNTVCDFEELEHEFTQSLSSAVVHLDHEGAHINLIDAPGAPDFLGGAMSVFPAVECALIVIDAATGIDPTVRRLVRLAQDRNLPHLIVVNKIDGHGNLDELLASLQETFGSECKAINLPADGGKAVIDCFQQTSGSSDLGDVADFHTAIIDQVVEVDEDLMAKYLEAGADLPRRAARAIRAPPFARPISCPSASCLRPRGRGRGRVHARGGPSAARIPTEGESRVRSSTAAATTRWCASCRSRIRPSPSSPTCSRWRAIPYVGKLCVFRVHQGTLDTSGDLAVRGLQPQGRSASAHVFKLQGKEHTEVERSWSRATSEPWPRSTRSTTTPSMHDGGDGNEDLHLRLHAAAASPMFGLAIEGTSKGAETKMGDALRKLDGRGPDPRGRARGRRPARPCSVASASSTSA